MPLGIAWYGLGVAGHVIAVVGGLGVLFAYLWLPGGTVAAHRARERLLQVLVVRGGLVALLLGLYLANDRALLGELWVLGPLVIIVVLLGTVVVVLVPLERRLATSAGEAERRASDERRARVTGAACAGLVAAAVFLMVTKPL